MFRPGDDPTLLSAAAVDATRAAVLAAFRRWRDDLRAAGGVAPDLLIVYGSFGAIPPRARIGSDVDVAVAGARPVDFGARLDLAVAVGEATGREVDVIDLSATHGPLLHAALCGHVLEEDGIARRAALLSRHWTEEEDFGPAREAMLRARRAAFLGVGG